MASQHPLQAVESPTLGFEVKSIRGTSLHADLNTAAAIQPCSRPAAAARNGWSRVGVMSPNGETRLLLQHAPPFVMIAIVLCVALTGLYTPSLPARPFPPQVPPVSRSSLLASRHQVEIETTSALFCPPRRPLF